MKKYITERDASGPNYKGFLPDKPSSKKEKEQKPKNN